MAAFLVLLWVPLFQELTQLFKEPELKGAFVKPQKPELSVDSFAEARFQKKWEEYENYNFGFRALFVKIKNSMEYLLFKGMPTDIIEGKDGFLYSYGSAERNLRGRWYNGKDKNENTLRKIKFLKEGIEKHGGHFFAVIVPSKESIVPENLPDDYDHAVYERRDYDDFVDGYKKDSIPFIDLCAYLQKVRDTCPFPLFTKTGFHWSMYCASLAQDTILKFMQNYLQKPMPQYVRTGIEWSDTARSADADFEEPMNLLFSLQDSRYVYPKIEMIQSTLKNYRPKVIIIGDSFFWQIKNLKTIYDIFSDDSKYWYYFKQSLPISDAAGCEIKDVDVMEELESADIVLLFGSMGIGEFPFGVTDYYYEKISKPKKTIISRDKKTFLLKAANNKYVCADGNLNNLVVANRKNAQGWETFSLLLFEKNQCSILAYNNTFLSAELGQHNEITATRDNIADWEIFTLIKLDSNHVAFKAANGKYLSVEEKTLQLFAIGNTIGNQEKFEMIIKK
ncbi:MAG: hypothetical protein HY841_07370 [Bacteroidetes bacterium]|nr:hypothetical protein [Bacteroidota bacterium]